MPLPTIMLCTNLTSGGGVRRDGFPQVSRIECLGDEPQLLLHEWCCPTTAQDDRSSLPADKFGMRQASTFRDIVQPGVVPWALQMKAISREEPSRAVKSLTGAILGSGGWVLSRSASDTGLIEILFEFERHSCLEIYSILIAAGLELSQSAHIRFTELCQCTRMGGKDCSGEIVSIDLEVQTSPFLEAGEELPQH
jgi:hypothetical protein